MKTLPLALASLLPLVAASCRPADDDTATDDDDSAVVDDDDSTPDSACTEGWEPLAVLDDFEADILDYSVDPESNTLAAITEQYLRVFDVSEPQTLALLATFDVQEAVDPTAEWVAISAAAGGHVVLARWADSSGGWAQVQLLDAAPTSAGLGAGTVFFTGPPDEYGNTEQVTDIAASGARSAVVTWWWEESTAYFLEHHESGLAIEGSRALPAHYWTRIAYTGTEVILPSEQVQIAATDPSVDIVSRPISGPARNPLETDVGWLIPTLGDCPGQNELYRLNEALTALEQIGGTAGVCDEYIDDGAHQLSVYQGEIFVANGGGRLIRGDWTPDDWVTVEGPSTLTPEVWEEYVGVEVPWAARVERLDDVLIVGGEWSNEIDNWVLPQLGLVRICPL